LVNGKIELTPGVNPDHIKSHIKSNYFVPSLLAIAIKETPHLSWFDKEVISAIWGKTTLHPAYQNNIELTNRGLTTTLSRYIRKQLGYQIS
jgi:hypothetical protein